MAFILIVFVLIISALNFRAMQSLWSFFNGVGVNILKDCFTVAGVARRLLFRTATEEGAGFPLISFQDRRLQEEILEPGIVGGASIVFCRYQEADVTFLHGESGKKCKSISGYDANSLYLACIGQEQPVGPYIHRRSENSFLPERREKYLISFIWLQYVARRDGIRITHALSAGREVRVLNRRVDGYCHETRTAFEFNGCW